MNLLLSPLEQFEIKVLVPLRVSFVDLSLTNSGLYSLLALFFVFLFFYVSVSDKQYLVPTRLQYLAEQLYLFILGMLKQQAGYKAIVYLPMLFSTFMFILAINLLGLTPFGFTVSSHIVVTFTFALSFNLGIFFLGLQLHSWRFFKFFVPSGVPVVLLPLIVVIEVVSYLIRTFSLSLRLFANMDGWAHTFANIVFLCCCLFFCWWLHFHIWVDSSSFSSCGYGT